MSGIDSFLADIGAVSLSTNVSLPQTRDGKGPAAQLHARIQDEITGVNDKTLNLIKSQWDDFSDQLKEGDELAVKLEEEERELKELEERMEGPDAFLPPLVARLTAHQSLAASHLLSTTSVTLLSALLTFHTTISTLSSAISTGDLPAALEALGDVSSAVDEGAEDWIEETDVWRTLVRWAGEEESRLESALQGALEGCFDITPASTDPSKVASLTLRERIAAAPGGPLLSVEQLFVCMEEFAQVTGRPSKTDGVLQPLAKGLLRHYIAPFLERTGKTPMGGQGASAAGERWGFKYGDNEEEGVYRVSFASTTEDTQDPIQTLSTFLAFFASHSSLFPTPADLSPSKYASTLTAHLTPPLQSHIISSHLSPSLPLSTSSLDTYLAIVSSAASFESTFLPQHGFFAFLPFSRPGGNEVEEQRVIRSWAARVPQHWAKAVGDSALARVRSAVKSWDWGEGETVEVEVREEEEMLGLLLGLGMGPDEASSVSVGTDQGGAAGKRPLGDRKASNFALETVPKGAKREMTVEEALAPKPPRVKTPPPPPAPFEPSSAVLPASSAPHQQNASMTGSVKRGKLGASRIATPLPPRSPSPPPLFQGGDAAPAAPAPSSPPAAVEAAPPAPVSDTFALLETPTEQVEEIETTADLASPGEVNKLHDYARTSEVDGEDPAVKAEEEEELHEFGRVKIEEGTPAPLPLTAERLLQGQAEEEEQEEEKPRAIKEETPESASRPVSSPPPPPKERSIKEESPEPTLPSAVPSTSLPLTRDAHAYDPYAPTEPALHGFRPQSESYGTTEPGGEEAQKVIPAEAGREQEEAAPNQPPSHQPTPSEPLAYVSSTYESSPYEPSPYEPFPSQPAPHEPASYEPDSYEPAAYEPSPYEPTPPELSSHEPDSEPVGAPSREPSQHEPASHEPSSYEPTPYEQEPASDPLAAPYQPPQREYDPPSPYEPAPYEPAPRELSPYGQPSSTFTVPEASPYEPAQYEQSSYQRSHESTSAIESAQAEGKAEGEEGSQEYDPYANDPYAHGSPEQEQAPSAQPAIFSDIAAPESQIRQQDDYQMSKPAEVNVSPSQPNHDPYAPQATFAPPTAPRVPILVSSPAAADAEEPATAVPPPPRASSGFAPPPRASSGFSAPPRTSPKPAKRVVSPATSFTRASAASPPAFQPYRAASPIYRPPSRPSSAASNGPVLNHIQQRFVSPPPSQSNPYVPLNAAASLSAQRPAQGPSYLPANDPLFADLFGSSSSKSSSPSNYFAPDPPGARLERSSSISSQSSQTSSFSIGTGGGAVGGGYRPPSAPGSRPSPQQQQFPPSAPSQQQAYNPYAYAPSGYGHAAQEQQVRGNSPWGLDDDLEELEDRFAGAGQSQQQQQPYDPYAYGTEQPSMRLRGGSSIAFSDESEEEEEDDCRTVLRLRGGADLGEMDEDDGNRSADDWGFGDDAGGDVEEDAWGFGEEEEAPAPSPQPEAQRPPPPALRSTPAAAAASPPRPPPPASTVSHVPSASISSVASSATSLPRSRPPSYAFSSALAPPPLAAASLGPAEEEPEEEEGGDEWGFGDEELEAPSPAVGEPEESTGSAVEPPRPATPPLPPPAALVPAAPLSPSYPFHVDTALTPAQHRVASESPELDAAEAPADDWGFHEEEENEPAALPREGAPEEARLEADESSRSLGHERSVEGEAQPLVEQFSALPVAAEDARPEEAAREEPVHAAPGSPAPLPEAALPNQPASPPTEPVSRQASQEPAEVVEDDGWGLDAREEADEQEPEAQPSELLSPARFVEMLNQPSESAPVDSRVESAKPDLVSSLPDQEAAPFGLEEGQTPLNAPAQDLHQPFPIDSPVRVPTPPTPQIPAPLPHHDVAESITDASPTEPSLQALGAQHEDDAALFEPETSADDGWGLGGEEDDSDPAVLESVASFLPDAREAATQQHDLPVESTLLGSEGADEGFADFTPQKNADDGMADFDPPHSPFVAQSGSGWEPFEEPGDVPVSNLTDKAPEPLYDEDEDEGESFTREERNAALGEAEALIDAQATLPIAARQELHELAKVDPPAPPAEPLDTSVNREGTMSSPEVIEHSDAWGFDGETAPHAGAELLDASPAESATAVPVAEEESVVQHEQERPIQHEETAVEHVAHRPLVRPGDKEDAIILPASDAHPQERTFAVPPECVPEGEEPVAAEQDDDAEGWDLGDADEGAEVFDQDAGPSPQTPDSIEAQHETALPRTPSQHDTIEALPYASQPSSVPASLSPNIADFDHASADNNHPPPAALEGIELHSHDEAPEETVPSTAEESNVQHVSEREIVTPPPGEDTDVTPLPAQVAQPQLHTFSPPSSALPEPEEEDAGFDDPWDLDPGEPSSVHEDPALQLLEQPHQVGEPVAKSSRVVTEGKPPADDLELRAAEQETDFPYSTPSAAAPSSPSPPPSPKPEHSARNVLISPTAEEAPGAQVLEADEQKLMALQRDAPAEDVSARHPEQDPVVQHSKERPVLPAAPEESAAVEVQPQGHTFDIPPSAIPDEFVAAGSSAPEHSAEETAEDRWGWEGDAVDTQRESTDPDGAGDLGAAALVSERSVLSQATTPPRPRAPSPPPQAPSSPPRAPSPPSAAATSHPSPAQPTAAVSPSSPAEPETGPVEEGWGWDGEDADASADAGSSTREAVNAAPAEQVEPIEEGDPREPSPSPIRREKMMVSKRSQEIVKIAEEVLLEALEVASPSFEHPDFAAATAPLLQTFVSLLSLYRATAAVHNSNLLASVPAIGMQFANDADWIGREVERVWKAAKRLQISSAQVQDVEIAIQSTRQLGKDTRQKQVTIQRAALMESLDEAAGFLRTSDDVRFSTCERALQQVTHTLQRLALVWKPVMTPTALFTTLGGLVNEVLLRVLDEIEDQTDISEEESIRLNALCKMLHELESLFEGSETSVGREVPIWFKFVFLSELLEASMADILFLFDHGHLVDFTPQEIVKLIRALFSDSALRNRNIEKVLKGHPEVGPEEEEGEW
ncbi:hypothetical protein JCM11641_006073 [Rhodosporidiobolus odoratus]